jgi:hypothetical protein
MVQQNEMSARALTMEEMENVNGGYPIKFIDELIGRGKCQIAKRSSKERDFHPPFSRNRA